MAAMQQSNRTGDDQRPDARAFMFSAFGTIFQGGGTEGNPVDKEGMKRLQYNTTIKFEGLYYYCRFWGRVASTIVGFWVCQKPDTRKTVAVLVVR